MFMLELFAISVPLFLLILFTYPFITDGMSSIARWTLSSHYLPGTTSVIQKAFLIGDVSFIDIPGRYPTMLETIINLTISLVLIILLPHSKRDKNIAIYFVFLAAINLVSSVYFSLATHSFPYTVTNFSELYIKAEISMWLFIPFILGMAFLPLPAPTFHKLMLIVFTMVYSLIFGTLRYIIFLFILSKWSVIYMALLFFAFGPLIDFVYIVGIYSYYNSRLAHNLKGSESVWKWSY
jgi:hypothetical protein